MPPWHWHDIYASLFVQNLFSKRYIVHMRFHKYQKKSIESMMKKTLFAKDHGQKGRNHPVFLLDTGYSFQFSKNTKYTISFMKKHHFKRHISYI